MAQLSRNLRPQDLTLHSLTQAQHYLFYSDNLRTDTASFPLVVRINTDPHPTPTGYGLVAYIVADLAVFSLALVTQRLQHSPSEEVSSFLGFNLCCSRSCLPIAPVRLLRWHEK